MIEWEHLLGYLVLLRNGPFFDFFALLSMGSRGDDVPL